MRHERGPTGESEEGASLGLSHLRRLFFGGYCSEADANGVTPYVQLNNPLSIITAMEGHLEDYNAQSKRPMPLAIFLYAVEHLSRISRVLRQEGGHVLCVGVGGSGRQSLSRLAAFICEMETFQVRYSEGEEGPDEELNCEVHHWPETHSISLT